MVLIKSDDGWVPAVLRSFGSESALQELLHQDSTLIPGCEGAAAVRELRVPGVGSVDLVCVDSEGIVTLVECKLKANPQIRREIIGQIIAYASGLAGTTYEQFDTAFTDRAGATLLNSVEAAAGAAIDPSSFRAAVAERLSSGAFRLVVAVDEITNELRQSVEYLNQHMSESVLVMALEMGYLKHNGVEVLVPQTYGAELGSFKRPSPTSPKQRWTEEDIATAVAAVPDQVQRSALMRLLKHAADHAAKFKGGTGANQSGGYYYLVAGARRSMWSLYLKPQGTVIAINLGSIANTSPALAQSMADTLRTAPVFSERLADQESVIGKYPEFSVASLVADQQGVTTLYAAFDLALKAPLDRHESSHQAD